MTDFYVYDNHHRNRARIHASTCPWCNDGHGIQGGSSGANDQWRGPYPSPEDAYAAVAHCADIAYCTYCRPQDQPFPSHRTGPFGPPMQQQFPGGYAPAPQPYPAQVIMSQPPFGSGPYPAATAPAKPGPAGQHEDNQA